MWIGVSLELALLLSAYYQWYNITACICSGSGPGSLMTTGLFWSILMIISFLLQAADTVLKVTSSTFGQLDYPNLLFCVIPLTWDVHFVTGSNIFGCCQKIKGIYGTGPRLYKVKNYETKCYTIQLVNEVKELKKPKFKHAA